jgi:hypothetical protein
MVTRFLRTFCPLVSSEELSEFLASFIITRDLGSLIWDLRPLISFGELENLATLFGFFLNDLALLV